MYFCIYSIWPFITVKIIFSMYVGLSLGLFFRVLLGFISHSTVFVSENHAIDAMKHLLKPLECIKKKTRQRMQIEICNEITL